MKQRRFLQLSLSFFFAIALLCSTALYAQQPSNNDPIQVIVTPDHADWLYKKGEKVTCNIKVVNNGKNIDKVKIYYEIGPEKMTPVTAETVMLEGGEKTVDCGTMKVPGFLRCKVVAEVNGKKYTGLATAGFDPMEIAATEKMPDDFLNFWENAKAENAKIPLDPRMTLVPERSTPEVDVYHISFQNYKLGSRIFGMLCVPKKEGKYPAVLKVPGAGVRAYKGAIDLAKSGIITLEIGIHGIPVNMPDSVYNYLYSSALYGYPSFNLDDKNNYYYKRVYLGCVKAIDFLYTLPQFDGQQLAMLGGSQGGALSVVTAALDKRVKYLVSLYPAISDLTGYLYGRAGGWPHMFYKGTLEQVDKKKLETAGYYDVVNFAKQLKVPGFYTWGYNDETCPPTSTFSVYNSITAPKEFYPEPATGHFANGVQWGKINSWLISKLTSGK
jgi:cephalosporin-C deacetylase